jgi:excisionase family DNA binding protein
VWQSYRVSDVFEKVSSWLSVAEAAQQLGIPKGKVNRLLEEYSLVGLKRSGEILIPADTIVDGEPLASLRGTIILLLDSGYSIEECLDWLYTESDVLGMTPLQALLQGRKSPVRRLAQMIDL